MSWRTLRGAPGRSLIFPAVVLPPSVFTMKDSAYCKSGRKLGAIGTGGGSDPAGAFGSGQVCTITPPTSAIDYCYCRAQLGTLRISGMNEETGPCLCLERKNEGRKEGLPSFFAFQVEGFTEVGSV